VAGVIVLDASVLIAYLDGDDDHHERAEELLAREIDDEFAVNSLTLAEVLVVPARENRMPAVRAALDALEVRELSFPADAGIKLAQLRAATMLKMPDCCVLLAAEDSNARLASFDDRLIRAAVARNITAVHG
jgi:predicted nucleic acid-binding protein